MTASFSKKARFNTFRLEVYPFIGNKSSQSALWRSQHTGCGTQHPLRVVNNTCVLLAAAPTAIPCVRHWRRSLLLPRKGAKSRKPFSKTWSMIFSAAQLCCGALLFCLNPSDSLRSSAPLVGEPLAKPETLHELPGGGNASALTEGFRHSKLPFARVHFLF